MARPLAEYFTKVTATDVCDYGHGHVCDFLWRPSAYHDCQFDWIITNPPFRLAEQFALMMIAQMGKGCAILVRAAFLESIDRYQKLFSCVPPEAVLQFVERVPMFRGRLIEGGATATSYCWLVWRKGRSGPTELHWLAPCRERLTKPGDYT